MRKRSKDEKLVVAVFGYEINLLECTKRGSARNMFIFIQAINLDLTLEIREADLKDEIDEENENTEGDSYCDLS